MTATDETTALEPQRYTDPYAHYSPDYAWPPSALFEPAYPDSEPASPYQIGAQAAADLKFTAQADSRYELPDSVWLRDMDAEWTAAFRAIPSVEADELQVDVWAADVSACTCQVAVTGDITDRGPDCPVHDENSPKRIAAPADLPGPASESTAATTDRMSAGAGTSPAGEPPDIPVPETSSVAAGDAPETHAPGDLAQVRDGEAAEDRLPITHPLPDEPVADDPADAAQHDATAFLERCGADPADIAALAADPAADDAA